MRMLIACSGAGSRPVHWELQSVGQQGERPEIIPGDDEGPEDRPGPGFGIAIDGGVPEEREVVPDEIVADRRQVADEDGEGREQGEEAGHFGSATR